MDESDAHRADGGEYLPLIRWFEANIGAELLHYDHVILAVLHSVEKGRGQTLTELMHSMGLVKKEGR